MSAAWTPGRWRERLHGVLVVGVGHLCPHPPHLAPVPGPGGTDATLPGPSSAFGTAYSTRAGIYWPGVVRTARKPDLRRVHMNLLR